MKCPKPKCLKQFEPQFDPTQGKHHEYRCECGQVLQWDAAVQVTGRGAIRFSPPRECSHTDLRADGALIPLV
jgi:hypothetical protein